MEFTVATPRTKSFEDKIAEVCKKFKVEFSISFGEKFCTYHDKKSDIRHYARIATVDIPEFNKLVDTGFTYLGCIKSDDIVSVHPTNYASNKGVQLSDLKEEIKSFPCVECGRKITRKIIHVFESDDTGEITVYGSGCAVKKFGVDLNRLVAKFQYIMEAVESEEFGSYGGRGYVPVDTKLWIQICFNTIVRHGYVSGRQAFNEDKDSTKQNAWDIYQCFTNHRDDSRYAKEIRATLPAELKEDGLDYEALLAWAEEFVTTLDDNDFGFNLRSTVELLGDNFLSVRLSGFAAYVVFKYWYDNVRIQEEKVTYCEDYSGLSEGDKLKKVKVVVTGVTTFTGQYGASNIYTFKDVQTDHKYKYFSTRSLEADTLYEVNVITINKIEDDPKWGKSLLIKTRAKFNVV